VRGTFRVDVEPARVKVVKGEALTKNYGIVNNRNLKKKIYLQSLGGNVLRFPIRSDLVPKTAGLLGVDMLRLMCLVLRNQLPIRSKYGKKCDLHVITVHQ
jgi:hypothetical protein